MNELYYTSLTEENLNADIFNQTVSINCKTTQKCSCLKARLKVNCILRI